MCNFLTPAAAYLNRRNELLAERSVVASSAEIHLINKALMASEIAMSTLHELEGLKTLQQRKARLIDAEDEQSQSELQRFELASNQLPQVDDSDSLAFGAYQSAFFELISRFNWQHASLEMAQNELFNTTLVLWLETLEELFASAHRRLLFIRVEKMLAFSIGKMPVLGDAPDVCRLLVSAMQTSRQNAQGDEIYLQSLESYTDVTNLCSRSILIFCFTTEALLRGKPLPDQAELNAKIDTHFASVVDGTHTLTDHRH
ncbi:MULTISPECIES: hypothetical protein [Erwinia]|uniref:hypothetical protein n=1 Tax=Erwinia TaxID=551 RepID=UPI0005514B50|nr:MULTISPECIES: hypothetical protein [Erwinia]